MATKQQLFTKVTGLTFDVEKITDKDKLAWLIPDGAMLDNEEGRKAQQTLEFMDAAGINSDAKFGTAYDDEDDSGDDSSDDLDDNLSTIEVQNG